MNEYMSQYNLRWVTSLFFAVLLPSATAGTIERVAIIGLRIACNPGEILEDLPPFQDDNPRENKFPLVDFYIYNCTLPKKNYAESFKQLNLTLSSVSKMTIDGLMPLQEVKDEMFQGVPFSMLILIVMNVQYNFYTERGDNFTGLKLSDLKEIKIRCQGDTLEEKPRSFFNRTLKMTSSGRLLIYSCPVPKKSYTDVMIQLKISHETIKDLELKLPPTPTTSLKGAHFEGLVITKLTIDCQGKHRPENDFLEPLTSLEEIAVTNMELPQFPNENNIHTAWLKRGESLADFGGCLKLKKLLLEDWEIPNEPSWLGHCANLREMDLNLLSKLTVKRALNKLTMITSLNVTNSNIRQLDGSVLADVDNLKRLNLQNNSLGDITGDAFKSQSKLVELDLTWNILTSWMFADYPQLVSLKKLVLDRNPIAPLSNNYNSGATSPPLPIEHISARYADLLTLSLVQYEGERRWDNLAFVDFSHNKANAPFSFEGISIPRKRDLTIDIRGNPLQGFDFDRRYEYTAMVRSFQKTYKLTIITDMRPLDCDCNYGWLGKALRELPHVSIEGATCARDAYGPSQPISEKHPEHQECYKFQCNNCTCRMDYYTLQVRADCRNLGLAVIPRNWTFVDKQLIYDISRDTYKNLTGQTMNLTELLASANRIKVVGEEDIPTTLELLDLHNNDIDRLNESVIEVMFEIPSRRVLLSGNPIVCDCANRPSLEALNEHRGQISDYSALRCVGTTELLSELSLDDLCVEEFQKLLLIAAVTGASFLALLVTVTSLYYRYRQYIKIYLYARGLCLCCVREEEADASRPFDAFVSFAHGDEALVEEQLLPHLENDYRLCVHTRSWLLGEMIHTQILRSVAQSRRTVIILSRNFVKSVWGMVEFRTAYMSALREGRVRLIVVVSDDVIDDDDLDPELAGYLKTYTYIRFDDPWFLKKLRYALPHRSTKLIGRVDKENIAYSGMLSPNVPPVIAVNSVGVNSSDGAHCFDLSSSGEVFEMRTN